MRIDNANGTQFRMNLPLTDVEHGSKERVVLLHQQEGTETILLAEDDETVRFLIAQFLSDLGYQVITAEDGVDAVVKFLAHRDSIRFMLLDVDMPLRNGKDAFDEISRVRPGVKVLFMSGSTPDILGDMSREAGRDIIMKPFSLQDLREKVLEILSSA